jgi:hypothetical protein
VHSLRHQQLKTLTSISIFTATKTSNIKQRPPANKKLKFDISRTSQFEKDKKKIYVSLEIGTFNGVGFGGETASFVCVSAA